MSKYNLINKWALSLSIFLMTAWSVSGQYSLTGPNSALTGETKTYTVSGSNIAYINWTASNGATIGGVSANSANCQFNNSGGTLINVTIGDEFNNVYRRKLSVTVCGVLNGGSINGAQTVCTSPANPTVLGNSASATGGNGTYTYQWYYSDNNSSWITISGATGSSYDPPTGLTGSRWYRRKVNSCSQFKYSNTVKVTMAPSLNPGTLQSPAIVCYGGNPGPITASTNPSGGDYSYGYAWQYSTTGTGGWVTISGATGATYDPPSGATSTLWYRKKVTSCTMVQYTAGVQAKVLADVNPGSINGVQAICYGGDPGTLGNSVSPSGGYNSYTYAWQYSNNGSSGWTTISGSTSSTYNPPGGLTATRWYRRVAISCNQNKYSNNIEVTVNPALVAGSISGNQSICSGEGLNSITNVSTATGGNGTYAYQWQSSTDNISWNNIAGANTTGYTPSEIIGTRWYRRRVTSCGTLYTTPVQITVTQLEIWYADFDDDGFGDPATSLSACEQPTGYVMDNTDACPQSSGSNNGCDYVSSVRSDENSIYTRTYQRAMSSDSEILENRDIIEEVGYFDGLGRPMQQIAIKASGVKKIDNVNEWSMDWEAGIGSTSFFNQNGQTSENQRELGINPFGKNVLVWKCGNDSQSDADGGWNTDYFNVDKNTTYRYTVWVKRSGSQDGITYHGTQNVNDLNGTANSNPYFWYGDLPQLEEWYLLVGVIHPYSYTGGDTGVSGVYDTNGNKVIDGTEFTWRSDTTTSRFRSYLYYSTDTAVRQYFWNPIMQKIDGTENSITEIATPQTPMDIVTHVGYDGYGRMEMEWLPYHEVNGVIGSYRTGAAISVEDYYKVNYANDIDVTVPNPFSQKEFEQSPLNRVLKQAAPGYDWRLGGGKEIEFGYDINSVSEVLLMEVTTALGNNTYVPTLVQGNGTVYYDLGELYKTVTKDESHPGSNTKNHTTEEFKDKSGRVVLKRTYGDSDIDGNGLISSNEMEIPHDTYYVYDDYGNLTYVIPPKVDTGNGVNASELSELCYQYVYDQRNRLVEKKLPGKGWEYIVYNQLDQPIMTQDPNLANQNKWLFTKYDALGRVAYTGIINNTSNRATLQTSADGFTTLYETKSSTQGTLDNTVIYYSNNAFPNTGIDDLLTINYYDNYTFDRPGLSLPAMVIGQATTLIVKGLVTGTKVSVLGTDDWITTMFGYDEKGRSIWTKGTNDYLNTTDLVETELDFAGKVLQNKTTHTKGTNAPIVAADTFNYDHMGRLLDQKQTIGSKTETIVDNTYDNMGQLVSKEVGGGLQTVDYKYNVRGWLKGINDPGSMGGDLFAFAINYNSPSHGGTGLFNGNISETEWRTANTDSSLKWYRYMYDPLNRITAAVDNTGNYNLSSVSYDQNGNIAKLNRKGHTILDSNGFPTSFGTMDDLTYSYMGNQLKAVDDYNTTGSNNTGFIDGAESTTEYIYDQNGNMISDLNKGISDIEYNYINQPTKITVGGTNSGTIDYVYAADGTKLKKITSTGLEVDYAGGYVYNNDVLQFFPHPEGYVSVENGSYNYIYNYSDHLGNIRLSYTDADGNGSIDPANEIVEENNYYPMGMKHKGYNEVISPLGNSIAKKWKFQGVEFEDALDIDLYEMQFRNYDPAIGRFSSIDPMSEQRNWLTPYNFVQNNPIVRVDPSGLLDDYGIDQNGNVSLIKETDDKFDRLYSVTSDGNGKVVKDENGEVVKNDTNGDGKVNNRDSSGKIRDRSVLPELAEVKETTQDSYHGEKNLRDATRGEGSQSDLFKVFNFAANNSNVEWSLYRLNIDGETQFNVGSYGNRTVSPGGSKFDQSQLVAGIHSHPNIPSTNAEETGSVFGDRSQTLGQIRRNGQAAGLKYIYFPNSNNIYNINNTNGKTSYIRNTGGDYRRFFFGTLNSQ